MAFAVICTSKIQKRYQSDPYCFESGVSLGLLNYVVWILDQAALTLVWIRSGWEYSQVWQLSWSLQIFFAFALGFGFWFGQLSFSCLILSPTSLQHAVEFRHDPHSTRQGKHFPALPHRFCPSEMDFVLTRSWDGQVASCILRPVSLSDEHGIPGAFLNAASSFQSPAAHVHLFASGPPFALHLHSTDECLGQNSTKWRSS